MMLDMKRTFDEFVESNADPERAAAILANPFYQSLSSSFAGTQEYMAMEKLGQLRVARGGRAAWDLIVVDTPPSRSALDFLDAPRRLGSFLDGRFIRLLAAPAKAGGRGVLQGHLRRVRHVHLGAQQGHRRARCSPTCRPSSARSTRSSAASASGPRTPTRMLQADDTAFLVVAAPERDALREASYFVERLEAESMPLAGLVLNRVQTTDVPELDAAAATAAAARLEHGIADLDHGGAAAHPCRPGRRRSTASDAWPSGSPRRTAPSRWPRCPRWPRDVVDLDGLRAVGDALAEHG